MRIVVAACLVLSVFCFLAYAITDKSCDPLNIDVIAWIDGGKFHYKANVTGGEPPYTIEIDWWHRMGTNPLLIPPAPTIEAGEVNAENGREYAACNVRENTHLYVYGKVTDNLGGTDTNIDWAICQ